MGWFSNSIPERKWPAVSSDLAISLKKEAVSWFAVFLRLSPEGKNLSMETLNESAINYVHLLQLQAVASAIDEGGYVKDKQFFLELVYIVLTGKSPSEMHQDIDRTSFCTTGSADASLALWSSAMLEVFRPKERELALVSELRSYGAFIVARAIFATCVACGDMKRANLVRGSFIN